MKELLGALFKLRWRETIVIVFSTLGDCFFVLLFGGIGEVCGVVFSSKKHCFLDLSGGLGR